MPQPHSSHGAAPAHAHDHEHDHDHTHVPTVTRDNERKILLSFVLIFGFMFVEAAGGWLSGSLALLADAGHMLTDAMALALAWAGFRFGRRAADSRRTFGYARFEVLAGFLNAITLIVIVGWIAYEAFHRLLEPSPVLAGPMLLVAFIGLLVNLWVLWILTRGDTGHVNVRGAILHVIGDLLGSVGAVVAALVIHFTGWLPIDPLLSVFVALLILRSAWTLLSRSLHILLEGAPENATPEALEAALMAAVPNLLAVRHIHVWQLTSGQTLATLHVRPRSDELAREVSLQVEQVLRDEFHIAHATVAVLWNRLQQVEICSLQED